jgi:hypothetical protein
MDEMPLVAAGGAGYFRTAELSNLHCHVRCRWGRLVMRNTVRGVGGAALAAALVGYLSGCAHGPGRSAGGSAGGTIAPVRTTVVAPGTVRSSGVSRSEATLIAPLPPARLVIAVAPDGVRMSWPSTGEDVAHYLCLRRRLPATSWQISGKVLPRVGAKVYEFVDRAAHPGATYEYGVQAVSRYGVSSGVTTSGPVTLP